MDEVIDQELVSTILGLNKLVESCPELAEDPSLNERIFVLLSKVNCREEEIKNAYFNFADLFARFVRPELSLERRVEVCKRLIESLPKETHAYRYIRTDQCLFDLVCRYFDLKDQIVDMCSQGLDKERIIALVSRIEKEPFEMEFDLFK